MNSLIRKFWEAAGHTIYGPNGSGAYEVYIGAKPIRKIETIYHGDKYHFNEKWYSEEEMLRIIKIKAFI